MKKFKELKEKAKESIKELQENFSEVKEEKQDQTIEIQEQYSDEDKQKELASLHKLTMETESILSD